MADDERPRGSCVIDGCPRDPYRREDGRVPLVCGPDVSRLRHWLSEIPGLCSELQAKSAPEEVSVRAEVRETLVSWTAGPGWHPPLVLARMVRVEQLVVAGALPAAAVGGQSRGGPVSGSPARRLPIDVDAVDLLAPASRRMPAAAVLRDLAYAEQDDDQIGFLPVAMMLDQWAEILREHRDRGEGMPVPSVTALCGWLLDRIDEAADDWLPIDEMFEDLRRAHGALRGQLGLVEPPQHLRGVPCPKCQILSALVRLDTVPDEPDRISCSCCGALLTIPEYEEYVLTLSTALSTEERERRKKAAADRRAVVRLLREMHAVGWRHTATIEVEDTDLVFTAHDWTRGVETIQVIVQLGTGAFDYILWWCVPEDAVRVPVEWVAASGVKRLHALATAAGVLSVPRERAA